MNRRLWGPALAALAILLAASAVGNDPPATLALLAAAARDGAARVRFPVGVGVGAAGLLVALVLLLGWRLSRPYPVPSARRLARQLARGESLAVVARRYRISQDAVTALVATAPNASPIGRTFRTRQGTPRTEAPK